MKKQFIKFFPSVMEATQNLIQSSIIMLIVSKAKGKTECTMQKTWVAEKLYIDRKTAERNIKKIEEMGFIKTETIYISINGEPKTTTHFVITPKLQALIGAEEKENSQPSKPSNHCQSNGNEKPIEKPQKPIVKQNNDDVDMYNYDLFLPIIMKQNERRG